MSNREQAMTLSARSLQEAEESSCHWFALMEKEEEGHVVEQFLMLFALKSDWEE